MTADLARLPLPIDHWQALIASRGPVGAVVVLSPAEVAELRLLRRTKRLPVVMFGRRITTNKEGKSTI